MEEIMKKVLTSETEDISQYDHPFMGKADTVTIEDIGDWVVCDSCYEDYTSSEEKGGMCFSGHSYCPKCTPKMLLNIKECGEEAYIEAVCPPEMTFKNFVLKIRGGDNTIKIVTYK
jgi:hypothetical protein